MKVSKSKFKDSGGQIWPLNSLTHEGQSTSGGAGSPWRGMPTSYLPTCVASNLVVY
jgi:hypothetical protein